MPVKHLASQQNEQFEIIPVVWAELRSVKEDFGFDWEQELKNEVFALQIKGGKQIVGLMSLINHPEELRIEIALLECSRGNIGKLKEYDGIAGCLIAYSCRLSFQRGYLGFVSLVPKTQLIPHYMHNYGFKIFGRQLAIDNVDDANYLIEKYLNYEEGL